MHYIIVHFFSVILNIVICNEITVPLVIMQNQEEP